jgi:tetraacyldisaccharide 4'-kinase
MKRPYLLPLLPIYAAASAFYTSLCRRGYLQQWRLQSPVISVGNLSTGGSGKTPLVIALANLLVRQGYDVDVLSRGYRRRSSGVRQVNPAGDASEFGDEPLLLARNYGLNVMVGADRWRAGLLAESHHAKESRRLIHLLDDGLQHHRLLRTLDVVLVRESDTRDFLLPVGNLRQSLYALNRASILGIYAEEMHILPRLRRMNLLQPVWTLHRKMIIPTRTGPVFAFCGIARPQQFFSGLKAAGLELAGKLAFHDHHAFTMRDIQQVALLALRYGAKAIVTTEKDSVRLSEWMVATLEQTAPLQIIGLEISFDDEQRVFDDLVDSIGPPDHPINATLTL